MRSCRRFRPRDQKRRQSARPVDVHAPSLVEVPSWARRNMPLRHGFDCASAVTAGHTSARRGVPLRDPVAAARGDSVSSADRVLLRAVHIVAGVVDSPCGSSRLGRSCWTIWRPTRVAGQILPLGYPLYSSPVPISDYLGLGLLTR
jgi:hypothetical protein